MSSRPLTIRLLAAVATAALLLPACGGDDGAGVRTIDDGGSASGSGAASGSGSASASTTEGSGSASSTEASGS